MALYSIGILITYIPYASLSKYSLLLDNIGLLDSYNYKNYYIYSYNTTILLKIIVELYIAYLPFYIVEKNL